MAELSFGQKTVEVIAPDALYPLCVATVTLCGVDAASVAVSIADADGTVYFNETFSAKGNEAAISFLPVGRAGLHTITFTIDKEQASVTIPMIACTKVVTPDEDMNGLFESLVRTVKRSQRPAELGGETFIMNKEWLRDHIHMMKGSRYWDENMTKAISVWMRYQHEEGFYYEILVPEGDMHVDFVHGDCIIPVNNNRYLIRLEIEADIEFLMVQAVYQAFTASGDADWLKEVLPSLEKAMMYDITSPKRWDEKLGLIKRGSSVDTWDWVYGQEGGTHQRHILDSSPMAIFHGDNTGFYQACKQMAYLYTYMGNDERAIFWSKKGDEIKENLFKVAWNGNFFAHMVHTHPTPEEAPDAWRDDFESDRTRLSLSNAYALNRGILDQEHAEKVIETFKSMRDNPPPSETDPTRGIFAEWITLYPSYRNHDAIHYYVDDYANGNIGSFTAGELLRGTFLYGYADYGVDIINRLVPFYKRDGNIRFMYYQDSVPYMTAGGGGPAAWGTAAIFDGVIAGLVGARDEGGQFENATLSPAWAATDFDTAYASVSYGPSDNYLAYTMSTDGGAVTYKLTGDCKKVNLSVLAKSGEAVKKVTVNDKEVEFKITTLHDSNYITLPLSRTGATDIDEIKIIY